MSNYYEEPSRQIPIVQKVEVLVVGGGPAGFGAALAAARMGRDVLVIEQSGVIGGIATNGIMSHWTGFQEGGCFAELLDRAQDCECPQVINSEKMKTVMLEMLYEAGAQVQMYTFFSEVLMEGNRVIGVITESKSGREAILCDIVIDSTGDGDVAARSGVPFEKGREGDGGMQPMTIMFKISGVDMDHGMFFWGFEDTVQLPEGDLQELASRELPAPAGHVLLYPSSLPGTVTANMTNVIGVDGTNVRDLNRADYECRKQINIITEFLRKYVPGFEACYVSDTANSVGVRETRRFEAKYQLHENDIAEAREFEDWVVTKSRFFFDMHNISGPGLDSDGEYKVFKQEKPYTIPLRCFLPQKVEGLLLNGRNISGTHKAHSSYRVMPICVNMGHAMGVVASLSVEKKTEPGRLNIKEIQSVLSAQNVNL